MARLTVRFPLEISSKNNGFDMIDGDEIKDLVKFNIKNTLLTCPDERTFDDEGFGACLRKILFEFHSNRLGIDVQARITSQLNRYVPYIVIEDISITNPEDSVMHIRLLYYINEIEARDELQIKIEI